MLSACKRLTEGVKSSIVSAIFVKADSVMEATSMSEDHDIDMIVMDPIPSSQHYPIGIQVNASLVPTTFNRRFNNKKAEWNGFTNELEVKIKHIRPTSKNYDQFAKLVLKDRSETSHKAVEGSIYLAFPRRVQHSMKTMSGCSR